MTMTMTRSELLASDEADYMDAGQLAYFRDLLQRERTAVLSQIEAPADLVDPTSFADPSDRASFEEERANAQRERGRLDTRLIEIGLALKRIESGDYGYCTETGDPIGLGRLLIQPTATLCIEAQERNEHRRRR